MCREDWCVAGYIIPENGCVLCMCVRGGRHSEAGYSVAWDGYSVAVSGYSVAGDGCSVAVGGCVAKD